MNAGLSRTDVARGFLTSPEYGSALVRHYYEEALGREPEPQGLAWWVAQGQALGYDQHLLLQIQASDEYYDRQGSAPGPWITALYAEDLGRTPDRPGETYWLALVHAGFPRTAITGGIVDSHEAHGRLVQQVYGQFLQRAPEPAGLAYWVAVLDSG